MNLKDLILESRISAVTVFGIVSLVIIFVVVYVDVRNLQNKFAYLHLYALKNINLC